VSVFSTDDAIGPFLLQIAVSWPFPAFFALYLPENRPVRENSTHNA
jgi:inner membrane protein involved in colicin E2 resistance